MCVFRKRLTSLLHFGDAKNLYHHFEADTEKLQRWYINDAVASGAGKSSPLAICWQDYGNNISNCFASRLPHLRPLDTP